MSLDRSLKQASGLTRHRNVLTRAERIERLTKTKKFDWATGEPLGLVKVGNRKVAASKGPKKEAAAEATAGAAPGAAAAAPAAAGAAPAKGAAAPAAGAAKGAAPAKPAAGAAKPAKK